MYKKGQFRKPKYETDYFDSLSRKVFYRPKFLLQELKLNPVTGSGHVSDENSYDNHADLRDRMDDFLDDHNVRARIYNVVHRLFDDKGIACCLLRKMIMMEPMTVKKIDTYLISLCERFGVHSTEEKKRDNMDNPIKPISCLKYNERLIKDIEHLLPSDFEPMKILDLSSTADSIKMLADRFPDAKVYDDLDKSESFDFIVISHYLHHLDNPTRTTLLKKITDKLSVDGYLFVREMDVETQEDISMSNFIHEVFYKSRIFTITYIAKDKLTELISDTTKELEFQSESRATSDYFSNPLKNYFMMFKKIVPVTESTKPKKGGKKHI